MSKILQIDGWFGGGKSVLLGLLDGHSAIAPNPIHDATHMAFLGNDYQRILEAKDVTSLRRLLAKSEYYYFEKFGSFQDYLVHFNRDVKVKVPFSFDFYAFDKAWPTRLHQLDTWTAESVMHTIYAAYASELTKSNGYKYFVTMSWSFTNSQRHFASTFPNGKSILVYRPVEDIIAVRSGRKPLDNTISDHFSPGFKKLMDTKEVHKILAYYDFWEEQAKKAPDRFLIVKLEDLVNNREATMKLVAGFLHVAFEEALLHWTVLGNEVKHQGVGYADVIQEKAEKLLSKAEWNEVQKQIESYRKKHIAAGILKPVAKSGVPIFNQIGKTALKISKKLAEL